LSQPVNNNPQSPNVVAPYLPPEIPALPEIQLPATTTSQGPPAQLPDGTWTDAQVELSNELMGMAMSQMAMDDMMFQQQMMAMQQRAATQSRLAQSQSRQAPDPPKLTTGPDIKSVDSDDGGDAEED
jgi:hypothetical protein